MLTMRTGFLKDHSKILNMTLRFIDLALITLAGIAAYYFSSAYDVFAELGMHSMPMSYLQVILLVSLLVVVTFPLLSIYRIWRGISISVEIKHITVAWAMVGLLLAAIALITKSGADFSRSWLAIWFVSGWCSLIASRAVLRYLLRYLRSNGYNQRHIVIVGPADQAMIVADRLNKSTWFGLEIDAVFYPEEYTLPVWLPDTEFLSTSTGLRSYVTNHGIDQVWIVLPHSEEELMRDVFQTLDGVPVQVRYVPDMFEYKLMHHQLTEMAGVPIVNISYSAISGANKVLKLAEDYLLSCILLLFAAPVMLFIAIGVKLSSPGPILYRQCRVGWNGEEFTMFKFRSMPVDAEKDSGPVWARQGESRATTFGSFLRKTSLDELPQLFNVLSGEMSLIGPRPERPVFVEKYKDEIPHYNKKHLVKAGLTGWAQVNGWRGNTCLHTRIEHDLYYIENWSLWLDIKIIFLTVYKGLVNKNAY